MKKLLLFLTVVCAFYVVIAQQFVENKATPLALSESAASAPLQEAGLDLVRIALPQEDVRAEKRDTAHLETRSSYQRLEGTVGDFPITMHLTYRTMFWEPDQSEPDYQYTGYYYYNKYKTPLELEYRDTGEEFGSIVLEEGVYDKEEDDYIMSGRFVLEKVEDGYEGVWRNPQDENPLRVVLREAYEQAEAIPLTFYDLKKRKGDCEQGCLSLDLSYLMIDETVAVIADLRNAVNNAMSKEVANLVWGFRELKEEEAEKERTLADYKSRIQLAVDSVTIEHDDQLKYNESEEEPGNAWMFNHSYQSTPQVMLNECGLLSVGLSNWSYTGGAHGYFYSRYYNYDVEAGEQLALMDIVTDTTKLRDLVIAELKDYVGIDEEEDLEEGGLFVTDESYGLTENFYLDMGGMTFSHPPYDIGPYAAGEIEVSVDYEELRKILKPSSVVQSIILEGR